MTRQELLESVENGESSRIEFKLEAVSPAALAEVVVAFANTEGGAVLIGVADDGRIEGVTRPDLETFCMNVCRENVVPPIIPVYESIKLADGKRIAVLTVGKSPFRPHRTQRGHYYLRVGSTNREASPDELRRLFQATGQLYYDELPVPGAGMEAIDPAAVSRFFLTFNGFDPFAREPGDTLRTLVNAGILTERAGPPPVATVGGLLLFGRYPQRWLPQSAVQVAHHRGRDLTDPLLSLATVEGRLEDLLERTLSAIRAGVTRRVEMQGARRVDREPYPVSVLREATVNALVHRDYSLPAMTRVLVFEDRIEFHSPGRLPNTVTPERMRLGISVPRHPFLLRYVQNLGYVERLGRGIPSILRTMRELGAPEPRLQEQGDEFVLTLFAAPLV